jgi:hypothetical protein
MLTKAMIKTPRDTPGIRPSRKVGQSHRNLAVDNDEMLWRKIVETRAGLVNSRGAVR